MQSIRKWSQRTTAIEVNHVLHKLPWCLMERTQGRLKLISTEFNFLQWHLSTSIVFLFFYWYYFAQSSMPFILVATLQIRNSTTVVNNEKKVKSTKQNQVVLMSKERSKKEQRGKTLFIKTRLPNTVMISIFQTWLIFFWTNSPTINRP